MSEVKQKTFRFGEAELADSALQAQILLRCRHSLDHDLKNAVQALHSGLEILSKSLQSPAPRRISPLECVPLLHQQLASLQQTLGKLLDEVAPEPAEPVAFDLVQLLKELLHFLGHEIVVSQVQLLLPPQAMVLARIAIVRRVLLSCILDALDTVDSRGSLVFTITHAISTTHSTVAMDLQVMTAAGGPALAASATRRQLSQILGRLMAGENASIAFADTENGYAITMHVTTAPVANPEPIINAIPAIAASARPAPAMRVLIVDDNRDAADSLALLLELEGYDTRAVYTGLQALALIDEYQPALVLLDIGLPDMDGDSVARQIRESSRPQPALVSVSGRQRKAGTPSSFDAELVKPVELSALQELIATLPSRQR